MGYQHFIFAFPQSKKIFPFFSLIIHNCMCRKKMRIFRDNSFKNCSDFLIKFSFFMRTKKSNFSGNQACQFFSGKEKADSYLLLSYFWDS